MTKANQKKLNAIIDQIESLQAFARHADDHATLNEAWNLLNNLKTEGEK